MALGNSQQRTTVILYLMTAMLAIPAMLTAFAPLYIALGIFLLLALITLRLALGKSQKRDTYVTT